MTPLVSIGLPVYNGLPHLERALETLLAQDYAPLELIVSDNASTDGTSELCRRLAQTDPRVRYYRNAENIGAMNNFRAVLERARGKYFMWAAHDDRWNAHFARALATALEAASGAVLATPAVLHMNEDGTLRNDPIDRPAAGRGGLDNVQRLFADHAASWIYGLYHTEFLRRHYDELNAYPVWGNDVLWLTDVCLRYQVVGSDEAMLWKRLRRSRFAPQNARQVVVFWAYMFWYFARISLRGGKGRAQQLRLWAMSWRYVYRLCIRRSNLLRTTWRVVRMLAIAGLTSIPAGLSKLLPRRRGANAALPTTAPVASAAPPAVSAAPGDGSTGHGPAPGQSRAA